MTLSDVLHEVMRYLELRPLTDVTIERGDVSESESPVGGFELHQLRFSLDDHVVRCAHRSATAVTEGIWSRWTVLPEGHLGGSASFDMLDVLATDWRILPP